MLDRPITKEDVGKRFVRRDGAVVTITGPYQDKEVVGGDSRKPWQWTALGSGSHEVRYYRSDGHYWRDGDESSEDLVARLEDCAPAPSSRRDRRIELAAQFLTARIAAGDFTSTPDDIATAFKLADNFLSFAEDSLAALDREEKHD